MTDTPWLGDACSLVDAFRAGERSPKEELQATYDAIDRSDLNCFSHIDPERALQAAASADLTRLGQDLDRALVRLGVTGS